jgi:DNA-binding GntR family transcriptional regulator
VAIQPNNEMTALASATTPPSLGGVLRQTTHATVLDILRRAILGGVLEAGTPLVQADLSAQLGVSKTPIREAIRDLAAEGLIDFDSYRSSVVHTPTLEEAQEIYELRLVLEPLAAEKAIPNITDEMLDEAARINDLLRATSDVAEWVDLNRQFHTLLTDPARSPRLVSLINGLRNVAAIQVAWSLKLRGAQMTDAAEDHDRILAAYRERDLDAAVEETKRHLHSTLAAIESFETARRQDAGDSA